MNRILLCEGMTDAILLSYYLERMCGWRFLKKPPKGLNIKPTSHNETVNWYTKGTDQERLLICAVGGKDNFGSFFQEKLLRPLIHSDESFEKLAIVTDIDDGTIQEIESHFHELFPPLSESFCDRKWCPATVENAYGIPTEIQTLLVTLPKDQQGALERSLLTALSENDEYDRNIIDKSCAFVHSIRPYAKRYISSERLAQKAELNVAFAIRSPEKVFSLIDELIRSVPWDTYPTLHECFSELLEI